MPQRGSEARAGPAGLDFPTALLYRDPVESLLSLDHQVFQWVNSTLTHPWLDAFFPAITDLHKTPVFSILVPILILVLLWKTYRFRAVFVLLGAFVCLGVTDGFGGQVLKKSFERPRPFNTPGLVVQQKSPAGGFSFPSNHALNTFAIATYVSFFIPAMGPFLFLIAVLVAYSRVYNGVHFPLDVLVGALTGMIMGSIFARLFASLIGAAPWWKRKEP